MASATSYPACGASLDQLPAGEPCPGCGIRRPLVVEIVGTTMDLAMSAPPGTVSVVNDALAELAAMPADKAREAVAHIIALTGEAVCRCTATGAPAVEFSDGLVSTDTAAAAFGVTQDAVYTPPPTSAIGRALANPTTRAILIAIAAKLGGDAVEHGAVALFKLATREPASAVEMVYAAPPPPPAFIQLAPPHIEPMATGEREPTPAPPLPPVVGPMSPGPDGRTK